MSYQQILEVAEAKLNSKHYFVIQDLKKCILSGSTGGEISSIVGRYLLDLKRIDYEAYQILESDILSYIKECEDIGILFYE